MDQNTKSFICLPSDILLQIFGECSVLDILALSSTCKRLRRMADAHQVWLHQVRRLQIPIPSGTTPSKAELKDWAISRTRVDVCWTKRHPGNLVVHSFETEGNFVDAHLIPGGDFVVLLFANGDIVLNRIEGPEEAGDLELREVARYKESNEADFPASWSRLLTETSYGCPVIVLARAFSWADPSVFLIDPVSQAIEKKQYIHCDFEGPGFLNGRKISAVKDRVCFVCWGVAGIQITIVAGIGRDQVIRRVNPNVPLDDDVDPANLRIFFISEYGFVTSNPSGIDLFHIPELEAVGDGYNLIPAWSWWPPLDGPSEDPSGYRGTFYKTGSPYPALWLQGEQTTHTLEFDTDESGCFPVVINHHIIEGKPAYYAEKHLKLKGRKVMGVNIKEHGEAVFKTGVLGKPDITRELHVSLPGLFDADRNKKDEVKYVDLDEVTGRIMVVIGTVPGLSSDSTPFARRLCLADVPI